MATKIKATTTTTPKSGPKPLTSAQFRKLVDERIGSVNERIDRIVDAITHSKKTKGL